MLRELVEGAGTGADVIAELGIGLNHAVAPRGHVMLDEKAGGTAHVAIGRNTGTYGGDNEATIHVDCVFSAPELEVDGRPCRYPVDRLPARDPRARLPADPPEPGWRSLARKIWAPIAVVVGLRRSSSASRSRSSRRSSSPSAATR